MFYGIALTSFKCVSKICFEFFYCYIYSPTCQTVVFNPFLWFSGSDLAAFEEETTDVAGEPQRVGKRQADNVI